MSTTLTPPAKNSAAVPVVTLRTLLDDQRVEAPAGALESIDDVQARQRYVQVLDKLRQETHEVGSADVLVTVQDRDASLLQSRIAELGRLGDPLPSGGLEAKFGEGIAGGDIWGWVRSVFDHISERNWHPIVRPPDTTPGAISDNARVAMLSDWGTNLYGAPVSAASIARTGGYELLLHLGDVYYSGTPTEMDERFLQVWPAGAGRLSRALNGNHEMYSGGWAYFDHVLPRFGQASSYFALQNRHWLLVGLDTAHTDHAMDAQQVAWLRAVVQAAGARKLVLFSHHQPFSMLSDQGPKLQAALAELLANRAVTAWYWGHEHECVLYERHDRFGLLGRCIGNGGVPAPRKSEVRNAPIDRALAGTTWRHFARTADAPSCLVLDGPNPLIPGEEEKFGPHGYVTLELAGPEAIERVYLPDGTQIFQGRVG